MYSILLQLEIGNGDLRPNTTYTVEIIGLRNRQVTRATINGQVVLVNYLVQLSQELDLSGLTGDLYVGGYRDVSQLKVCSFSFAKTH